MAPKNDQYNPNSLKNKTPFAFLILTLILPVTRDLENHVVGPARGRTTDKCAFVLLSGFTEHRRPLGCIDASQERQVRHICVTELLGRGHMLLSVGKTEFRQVRDGP